jgi:hypothetical protein
MLMTLKFPGAIAIGALSLALMIPAAAGAAGPTELGSNCTPNVAVPEEGSLIEVVREGSGTGSPVAGVITSWRLRAAAEYLPGQIRLQVWHPGVTPGVFTLVAQSEPVAMSTTEASFPTRVPIAVGDRLALSTAGAGTAARIPYCFNVEDKTDPEQMVAFLPGAYEPGAAAASEVSAFGSTLPVVATIEPDADGDGFGDLTQDLCPTDATTQGPCKVTVPAPAPAPPAPRPRLEARAKAHPGSVSVHVGTDLGGKVKLSATAAVGHGKTVRLRVAAKTLAPGTTGSFVFFFPPQLRERLAELPAKRSLALRVVATSTAPDGQTGSCRTTVHLHGTS